MANQDNTPPINDCIVVQTDFAFDLILSIIAQLNKDRQLHLQSVQNVQIENIRSNNKDDEFKFGGKHAHKVGKRMQSFARTATSVLRMCMLRSANVPAYCYPELGEYSKPRNLAVMRYFPNKVYMFCQEFVLTTNRERAREYYSYYDHLYPHFRIEDQLLKAQPKQLVFIPETMMLIFRENFSEIIAFNTSLRVRYWPNYQPNIIDGSPYDIGGRYESFANVVCQVNKICNPDHVCLNVLKLMKGGNCRIDTLLRHLSDVNWAEENGRMEKQETEN